MNTIICHSFPAWDSPYIKSTLELITRMAATHRVIFLDYPYTLKDYWKTDFAPKAELSGKNGGKRLVQTDFGPIEIYNSLPVIPSNWSDNPLVFEAIMKANAKILGRTIRKILRTVNPKTTQVINAFNPVFGFFTRKYWGDIRLTYYAYDELSAAPWAGKWGKNYEIKFLNTVDRVVVSSSGLLEKFSKIHPLVNCVKNGVNLNHFLGNMQPLRPVKKMGYLGAFDERIDLDLLAEVALAFPEYLIEVIGPKKINPSLSLPNHVVFLGPKPQNELLTYLSQWSVCLIPFSKTPFTRTIYPLKINEYLAAGKPVVTTDFADLSDFEGIIRIGTDSASFIRGIQRELRGDNRLKASKRRDFAVENSWEVRTTQFLKALAS